MDKPRIIRNVFIFNPEDNGGEQLILKTTYKAHGHTLEEIDVDQKLILESYNNSASFYFSNLILNPQNLRKLADELEKTQKYVKECYGKSK